MILQVQFLMLPSRQTGELKKRSATLKSEREGMATMVGRWERPATFMTEMETRDLDGGVGEVSDHDDGECETCDLDDGKEEICKRDEGEREAGHIE